MILFENWKILYIKAFLLLSLNGITIAQSRLHAGFGLSYLATNNKNNETISLPAATISGRYDILYSRNATISAGSHPSICFPFPYNKDFDMVYALGLDLPLMMELNLGNGATEKSDSYVGLFGGVGYGMNYLWDFKRANSFNVGMIWDTGICIELKGVSYKIKFSKLLSANQKNNKVICIGLLINAK